MMVAEVEMVRLTDVIQVRVWLAPVGLVVTTEDIRTCGGEGSAAWIEPVVVKPG